MKLKELRQIIREELQKEFLRFGKKKAKSNPLKTNLSIEGQLYRLKDYLDSIGFTQHEDLAYNNYNPAMDYAKKLKNIDKSALQKIFEILWKGYEKAMPNKEEFDEVLNYIQTADDTKI